MGRNSQFKQCCYYCGEPYSSMEHAPPEHLFDGYTCNKIKVPSCELHNGVKSESDNAVLKGMLISLDTVSHMYPPQDNAAKAISIAKSQFPQVKNQVKHVSINTEFPPLTYIGSSVGAEDWMRKLTAALIYDGGKRKYDSGNKFDEAIVFSPTWVSGKSNMEFREVVEVLRIQKSQENSLEKLNWELGWSSGKINYPIEVYNFKLNFDYDEEIVFKHQFWDSVVWYVGVKVTKGTRENIIDKVRCNNVTNLNSEE